MLLERGADVDALNENSHTALEELVLEFYGINFTVDVKRDEQVAPARPIVGEAGAGRASLQRAG